MEIRFLTIRDWMLQLGLSYTEVVAFAIVWSFTHDGEDWFQDSAATFAKWMCVADRRTARKALASLVEKRLIEKRDRWVNGVHLCDYRALGGYALKALGVVPEMHRGGASNAQGVVHAMHQGGASNVPHNNIKNNNGYKYPHKKEYARTRVVSVHGERFIEVWETLLQQPGWDTKSESALDEYMKDLNAVSEDDAIEMVRNSIKNGWKGIFPLSRRSSRGSDDEALAAYDKMLLDIDEKAAARAASNNPAYVTQRNN